MDSDSDGTVGHTGGNTRVTRVRSRGWCFTWNNPPNEAQIIEALEASDIKGYIFQEEIGELTGTRHFQGCLYWVNPIEFNSVQQIMFGANLSKAKNIIKAVEYCQKEKTAVRGPWAKHFKIKRRLDIIKDFRLWQAGVVERVSKPCRNDREIYWYVDYKGGQGKTVLAKYLVHVHKALYVSGRALDIKHACMKHLESNELNIVIFDFPRTVEEHVSYDAIESVKNGIFFSGKYDSGMACFNSPHVIIFANFKPDESKLSDDRWVIIELDRPPSPKISTLMEWL